MSAEKWICLRCRAESDPSDDLKACPSCGGTGIPASTHDRVTVTITWHELRVLVMWAEFWATARDDEEHQTMRRVVYGIADGLQLQHLDKPGLTFASEIADLKEEFGEKNVQVIRQRAVAPYQGERMDERAKYPTPPEGRTGDDVV